MSTGIQMRLKRTQVQSQDGSCAIAVRWADAADAKPQHRAGEPPAQLTYDWLTAVDTTTSARKSWQEPYTHLVRSQPFPRDWN